jgi:type VI secretion system secreted protein Hcp
MVTSVSAGGSGGEDRLTENVSLNFARIKWTYTEQDFNGACSKSTTTGWDVQTNQPWK